VEVRLIVPAHSNHPVTDFARRHYLRELRRAGAHVQLFLPGMLHSKAVIVDNRLGLIGSANFDPRSLFVNFEIGVVIHTAPEVQVMTAWAMALQRDCREVTGEPARRGRWLGHVAEDLSRLLAPLL
jgi:cardiolipin synthase